MTSDAGFVGSVAESGFALVPDVITRNKVSMLTDALSQIDPGDAALRRGGIFAMRNLLELSPEIRELVASVEIRRLIEPVLGAKAFAVRGILFDKIPGANWKVPWHQDITIAVKRKLPVEGFAGWTTKSSMLHVQAPATVLNAMLSVRIHLDECSAANGALRVIPGSHLRGRIDETALPEECRSHDSVVCEVKAGGALLMRPLLLHASSPSDSPGHRRVIHIDYAADNLPGGLEWLLARG